MIWGIQIVPTGFEQGLLLLLVLLYSTIRPYIPSVLCESGQKHCILYIAVRISTSSVAVSRRKWLRRGHAPVNLHPGRYRRLRCPARLAVQTAHLGDSVRPGRAEASARRRELCSESGLQAVPAAGDQGRARHGLCRKRRRFRLSAIRVARTAAHRFVRSWRHGLRQVQSGADGADCRTLLTARHRQNPSQTYSWHLQLVLDVASPYT